METKNKIAEIQVSYLPKLDLKKKIKCSHDAYLIVKDIWNPGTISLFEEFRVMLLNRNNCVLGIFTMSKGGISSTVVDLRLIFGVALKAAASSIILVHNHPSGNHLPSEPDKQLTENIRKAGELLHIKLLDHVILTKNGYYSFADEGRL